MPSDQVMGAPADFEGENSSISADWLWSHLRDAQWSENGVSTCSAASGELITLLDCRSPAEFGECHIRRAVHLSLPSIMLRRLAGGKVTIGSVLKSNNADVLSPSTTPASAKRPWGAPVTTTTSTTTTTADQPKKHTFVLCGGGGEMVAILRKSLVQDGCPVVCLQGGVEEFRTKYPEWCVTRDSSTSMTTPTMMPVKAASHLRIAAPSPSTRPLAPNRRPGSLGSRSASDSEEERPDSSLESNHHHHQHDFDEEDNGPRAFGSGFSLGLSVGLRLGLESEPPVHSSSSSSTSSSASSFNGSSSSTSSTTMIHAGEGPVDPLADPGFPVEILPHLFLGNAQNSRDCDSLDKHCIRYVVNVTPNLPNVFEDSGTIKYLQIPITDHWSQNLASFFPSAISFIDGARERQQGVLVHCLAGISRSVTITVAYLMYKMSMSMNDAYDYVRSKKSNISPNFNFMGQLLDFERQLNPPSPARCTCHLASTAAAESESDGAVVEQATAISFTRLSIEEPDEPDDGVHVDDDDILAVPSSVVAENDHLGRSDSGLPSMSPSSVATSPALVRTSSTGSTGAGSAKRLRTLVCRCQASLAQCHFTTPTPL